MLYIRFLSVFLAILALGSVGPAQAEQPRRLVVLGDSLSAGYGLPAGEDFVTKLQQAMVADGLNVTIDNAGVSGDTSAGGRARLEWAIEGEKVPALVIVALGGNDLLRGLDPKVTKENLSFILKTLKNKKIPAFLVGMKSPTNLGPMFQSKFDDIYPDLADEYDVPLLPFFLQDVAMVPSLNQADGIHPNQQGVAVMVKNIMPALKEALED